MGLLDAIRQGLRRLLRLIGKSGLELTWVIGVDGGEELRNDGDRRRSRPVAFQESAPDILRIIVQITRFVSRHDPICWQVFGDLLDQRGVLEQQAELGAVALMLALAL